MKRKISRWTVAWVLIALATVAHTQTAAEATRKLSLKEAVSLALRQQPNLASTQAQADAARQGLIQARAAFFPTVSLNYTTNDTYQSNGQQLSTNSSAVTSSTKQGDIVLSYQLLDSGQRAANVQSAQASLRASQFATQYEEQTTIATVVNAYYTLLQRRALIKVQQSNVEHAQATLDTTSEQARLGGLAKKDVLQAEADLDNAKVSLIQAQNEEAVASSDLKEAIGIASDERIEPTDDLSTEAISGSSETLASLLETAYKSRPDIREAMQNVEREKANVRYAQAANGISLSVDTNLTGLFAPSGGNSRSIGLTASLPLFNGGYNRAAIEQAKATQKSVEAQLAAKKVSVAGEVESSYRRLQSARAAVPAAETAQKAAQVNFEAASASWKEGVGTVLDVITAQDQLVQAQTNYIQALYDLYVADVSLQKAIGHTDVILARIGGSK